MTNATATYPRSSKLTDSLESCRADIAALQAMYVALQGKQAKLSTKGSAVGLVMADPKTGESTTIMDMDVERVMMLTLPQILKDIEGISLNARGCSDDEDEEGERSAQRKRPWHGVVTPSLGGHGAWFVGQLRFCNLEQTGEITDSNCDSMYKKEHKAGGGNVQRVLRTEAVPMLHEAPHWPKTDRATGEFLTTWADLSHRLLEVFHMMVVHWHLADVLDAASNMTEKKGFDESLTAMSSTLFTEILKWYKVERKDAKGEKPLHGKSNRFDPKKAEHAASFAEWLRENNDACYDKLLEMDAKTRIIGSPHRYNANSEHVVQLSSNLVFNKAKTPDTEVLRRAWAQVANYHLLSMHRAKQHGDGEYEERGEPWSRDLQNRLTEKYWPQDCNQAASELVEDMIKRGVVPEANGVIVLKDSSGRPLKSPCDQRRDLSVFEAACAFGELCDSRWRQNRHDAALALIDLSVRQGNGSVYYGSVTGIQCILPAKFVKNVMRGVWWAGHRNEGQPTDPPTYVNLFDDMPALMANATRVRSADAAMSAADRVLAEQRVEEFVDYGAMATKAEEDNEAGNGDQGTTDAQQQQQASPNLTHCEEAGNTTPIMPMEE